MTNFEKWDKEFRAQNLYVFNNNESALLYLKVRAVCRGKQIKQFVEKNGIELTSTKINEQFAELYSIMENTTMARLCLILICATETTNGITRWVWMKKN